MVAQRRSKSTIWAAACLLTFSACILAACGGGDAIGPSAGPLTIAPRQPQPPQVLGEPRFESSAVYGGTMTGSTSQDLVVVIDDDRTIWALYGSGAPADFRVAGLLRGGHVTGGTHLKTSYAYVFDGDGSMGKVSSINLAFDSSVPSMTGAVATSVDSRSVAGGELPGFTADATPTLEEIKGRWSMTTAKGSAVTATIEESGQISITDSAGGCIASGFIRPSNSGKTFAVRLRDQRCADANSFNQLYGFAIALSLQNGGMQLLIAAENGWDPLWLAASGKR